MKSTGLALNKIREKITSLGGVEPLKKRKNDPKVREQLIKEEKLPAILVDFIDAYSFAMFNNTVGCKSLMTIPFAGKGKPCEIGLIYGWSKGVDGIKGNLDTLKDEDISGYVPFAESFPGDQLCLYTGKGAKAGKIYYWSHDDAEFYLVAHSLEKLILGCEIIPESEDDEEDGPELISAWFADDF